MTTLWVYNPECVWPRQLHPKAHSKRAQIAYELQPMMYWFAQAKDQIWVERPVSKTWQGYLKTLPGPNPSFVEQIEVTGHTPIKMWGEGVWRGSKVHHRSNMAQSLTEAADNPWHNKAFGYHRAAELFKGFDVAEREDTLKWTACKVFVVEQQDQMVAYCKARLDSGDTLIAKAPYGTAGSGVRWLRDNTELEGSIGGWMRRILRRQGCILLEPYLDIVQECSVQMEVRDGGVQRLLWRDYIVDRQRSYLGTRLGNVCLEPPVSIGDFYRRLAEDYLESGYQGWFAVDACWYLDTDGKRYFRPVLEINPRRTMTAVAIAVQKRFRIEDDGYLVVMTPARMAKMLNLHLSKEQNAAAWFRKSLTDYLTKHRCVFENSQLKSGLVALTDYASAQQCCVLIAVGDEVMRTLQHLIHIHLQNFNALLVCG